MSLSVIELLHGVVRFTLDNSPVDMAIPINISATELSTQSSKLVFPKKKQSTQKLTSLSLSPAVVTGAPRSSPEIYCNMKINVKTLKGTHFEIQVQPQDTVADVKRNIEREQGAEVYPAAQQMLIHQGKVLKDDTTLEDNKVAENSFVVIMLSKSKVSSGEASTASSASAKQVNTAITFSAYDLSLQLLSVFSNAPFLPTYISGLVKQIPLLTTCINAFVVLFVEEYADMFGQTDMPPLATCIKCFCRALVEEFMLICLVKQILNVDAIFLISPDAAEPASSLPPTSLPSSTSQPPASTVGQGVSNSEQNPVTTPASDVAGIYGQAASNLISGSNLESTIQQILDMGGGSWDRDTVIRALRAAFNNPERAVEYLYSGIPEQAEVPAVARTPAIGQAANPSGEAQGQAQVAPSGGPNTNPLNLFPQGIPDMGANENAGDLDFLRNSQQFQALRAMVQANPQILQPMLQELGRQNPHLMQLIQEHQADFLRLINEPDGEENLPSELASAVPQTITVTPEENEAIQRLQDMGFDRDLVLEVFFACNKNEDLAANYLLDHQNEFED
ncbi:hypothetical protein Ahy_A04g017094 isoform A [Arachis hypogaea]|uniref:DNA repair protein RAD23 n=1 Tax=Arachis hypogaea TaxID=3818 RepID=A0A445D9W3_ARAHY|nr:hypothetical protein Ahy_A04g017094 isoform A [Arachis hypogaea]